MRLRLLPSPILIKTLPAGDHPFLPSKSTGYGGCHYEDDRLYLWPFTARVPEGSDEEILFYQPKNSGAPAEKGATITVNPQSQENSGSPEGAPEALLGKENVNGK